MTERHTLHQVFRISIILKGLDGLLELIGGLLLVFLSPDALNRLTEIVFHHELVEDPHDFVASYLLRLTADLSVSATLFGAAYLFLHGVVKVVLVWAVLKDKLWAYPWMIGFLIGFIVYQSYEMIVHFSAGLMILTVFDMFVTWLTWAEYRKRRRLH